MQVDHGAGRSPPARSVVNSDRRLRCTAWQTPLFSARVSVAIPDQEVLIIVGDFEEIAHNPEAPTQLPLFLMIPVPQADESTTMDEFCGEMFYAG